MLTNGQLPKNIGSLVYRTFLIALAFFILWGESRGLNLFFDEWDIFLRRSNLDAASLLVAHNGHLIIPQVIVFNAVWKLAGVDSYWILQCLSFGLHIWIAHTIAFQLSVQRFRINSLIFFFIVLLGAGWQNILWPFQIGFNISILATLKVILFLKKTDLSERSLGAMTLLGTLILIALFSSGLGVVLVLSLALSVIVLRMRVLFVGFSSTVPVLFYLVWKSAFDESPMGSGAIQAADLVEVIKFFPLLPAALIEKVFGVPVAAAFFILGSSFAFTVCAFLPWHGRDHFRLHRFIVVFTFAFLSFFWLSVSIARHQYADPYASRYIYVAVIMICLAIFSRRWPRRKLSEIFAATLLSYLTFTNYAILNASAETLRSYTLSVRDDLQLVEESNYSCKNVQPSPSIAPQINDCHYLSAVRTMGSPFSGRSRF